MQTIFEKIANRHIPSHIVWEDISHIAFLDINPEVIGHTLLVPKINIGDDIFKISLNDYTALFLAAYKVANYMKVQLGVGRVIVKVVGTDVPHIHVHLIPYYDISKLEAIKSFSKSEIFEQSKIFFPNIL